MKNLRTRFLGLTNTVSRFPITILCLLIATVLNTIVIITNVNDNYPRLIFAILIGAAVYAVLQMIYEGFCRKTIYRVLFMVLSITAALVYLFTVRNSFFHTEVVIRTIVILFILLIAFLWVPSIQSEVTFNESFMAAFKAFFVSLFFSGITFLGTALIIGTLNKLLFRVDSTYYTHAANIIFVLYAPLYFFSLIPLYSGNRTSEEDGSEAADIVDNLSEPSLEEVSDSERKAAAADSEGNRFHKAVEAPRFLENLLSFVIVPVTAIFTVILLIYIIVNITGEFWTDNLLEPLLVSYSITVIIVYLLTSRLKNRIAVRFRRIFPKVLVPVVLFQTIASILKIGESGVTYGRYYVILFGVFATIAGLLFCFLPVRKNGLIAPVLILLATLSVLPPVDAFTISQVSQTARLKNILIENEMLSDNVITPNSKLASADKQAIREIMDYLERMRALDRIEWLKGYHPSEFYSTFGFSPNWYDDSKDYKNIFLYLKQGTPINISGYDFILDTSVNKEGTNSSIGAFEKNGHTYTLQYKQEEEKIYILLKEKEEMLLRFPIDDIFNRFTDSTDGIELTPEEATFTVQNDWASLTLVTKTVNINSWQDGISEQSDAYILVKIK